MADRTIIGATGIADPDHTVTNEGSITKLHAGIEATLVQTI